MRSKTILQCQNKSVSVLITKPAKSLRLLAPVRSLIHVSKKYKLKAGSYLYENGVAKFLIAEHHEITNFDIFLGLKVNCTVAVKRSVTEIHPVTKQSTNRKIVLSEEMPAVLDLVKDAEDSGFVIRQKVYYLGNEVTTQDFIDEQRVKLVTKLSGLYVAEVA